MGKHKNTITFNGQVFDTVTGRPVKLAAPVKHAASKNVNPATQIIKPSTPVKVSITNGETNLEAAQSSSTSSNSGYSITVKRTNGTSANKIHHKTNHSKTLMRSALKHPSTKARPTKISTPTQQPSTIVYRGGHIEREFRSSINLKSHKINKFSPQIVKVSQKIEHIPVKSAPKEFTEAKIFVVKQAPPITKRAMSQVPKPVIKTASSIFETAMQNSDSHKGSSIGKKHRRFGSKLIQFSASFAVVLLLLGFFAYHNETGLALRSASSKAGFSASLPKYKPVGFNLTKMVQAEAGSVTLNYNSNSGGNGFSLRQVKSDMDSQKLVSNVISNYQDNYATSTPNGRTIFIYNGSNATWIKDGVWYNLVGNAQLSSQQIIKIAASI